ncbi:hypothetical protein [Nocardia jejuensis]|uniref:hypothetical protein n=1 Tax=Nocardia jejuensis TaxID=328049 RepID=UPI00082F2E55|nr:hypothetical protein [Nocardia jejuensis]
MDEHIPLCRHDECHLRICSGPLVLDFRATVTQARNFIAALRKWPSAILATIDDDLSNDLPLFPCSSLWD